MHGSPKDAEEAGAAGLAEIADAAMTEVMGVTEADGALAGMC